MLRLLRTVSLALLSIFLFLTFSACSHDDTPNDTPIVGRTLFVYFPYSGPTSDLYSFFVDNISAMETAIKQQGCLGDNRLLLFLAKAPQTGQAPACDLMEITYSNGTCTRHTLQHITDYNFASPDALAALLRQVTDIAPADNYAMIVGGHGEGWLPVQSSATVSTRYFGGSLPQYQMTVSDFAKGVSAAGVHLQFLLFDDCYISCMENVYDLRHTTDWLIASTSEIMAKGMPYDRILPYLLQAQPDYAGVVEQFHAFYQTYRMPYGTIAATDCSKAEPMAELMRTVNATHTFDNSHLADLQDLDAAHWTPTVYFDFGDYVQQLCGSDTSTYNTFLSLLRQMTPYKATTDHIYSESGHKSIAVTAFSGLTISDPSENAIAVTAKKNTAWWTATHQ